MMNIHLREKMVKGAAFLLAFLLLAGCGHKKEDVRLAGFMEFFISVYAPQDEMFFTYLKAMEDMVALLKEDGTRMEEAADILAEAHDRIEEVAILEFAPDDDMKAYMKEKLLSVAELSGLAKMAFSDREDYLETLEILAYALETGAADGSISSDWIIQEGEFRIELQRLLNQYHYYAGNEFFSVLDGDELEYVCAYLSDNLRLYSIDGVEWQDNADDAFEKEEEVWKQIEALE